MSQNRNAELDTLAKGYLDILSKGVSRNKRGELFEDLFLQVIAKYLPPTIAFAKRAYVGSLRPQWDLILFRGNSQRRPAGARIVAPLDVVGIFEEKSYGVIAVPQFAGEEGVTARLSIIKNQFLDAQACCTNLRLSCYFSLQERTPKRQGINYHGLAKQILEPDAMTVIPFHAEFKKGHPTPPMYPDAQAEWNRLLDRIVHL